MNPAQPRLQASTASELSPREREILGWIALGYSNAEVGAILYLSAETVKSHMRRTLLKLDSTTRAGAVYRAIERGELRTTPSVDETTSPSRPFRLRSGQPWSGVPDDLLKIHGRG